MQEKNPELEAGDDLPIAFLSTYPPRKCGIATFAHDLSNSMQAADVGVRAAVLGIADAESTIEQPDCVQFESLGSLHSRRLRLRLVRLLDRITRCFFTRAGGRLHSYRR